MTLVGAIDFFRASFFRRCYVPIAACILQGYVVGIKIICNSKLLVNFNIGQSF